MKQKLFTRNFTLLILGQTSSLIGNFSLKFALSMYILEQTGSASVFAGLLAISMLPTVLLSPLLAEYLQIGQIVVILWLRWIFFLVYLCAASFAVPSKHDIIVIGICLSCFLFWELLNLLPYRHVFPRCCQETTS